MAVNVDNRDLKIPLTATVGVGAHGEMQSQFAGRAVAVVAAAAILSLTLVTLAIIGSQSIVCVVLIVGGFICVVVLTVWSKPPAKSGITKQPVTTKVPIEVKLVPGVRHGSMDGLNSTNPLTFYRPESVPRGWYALGHSYEQQSIIIVNGSAVKECTDWLMVWMDRGSWKSQDYSIWIPTCDDPDYHPLGVVCTCETQRSTTPSRPDWRVALVHKNHVEKINHSQSVAWADTGCCLAYPHASGISPRHHSQSAVAWVDTGSGARDDVTLDKVVGMNLMWPRVATRMKKGIPQLYRLRRLKDLV